MEVSKENLEFLKSLLEAKRYSRKNLLRAAKSREIKFLREIAFNISKNSVKIKPAVAKRIISGKYRKYIRLAGETKGSLESKRKIFLSHAGMLDHIIPATLTHVKKNFREVTLS